MSNARYLRMTESDKRRKLARQFVRRLEATAKRKGDMHWKLGNEEYWRLYDQFFLSQKGRCAICNKPPKEGGRRLALDHSHVTHEVRGLLCFSCNSKLGFFEKFFGPIIHYLGYEVV